MMMMMICPNVNGIAWREFELASVDTLVQQVYTTIQGLPICFMVEGKEYRHILKKDDKYGIVKTVY